ncbi:hypothetical protein CVT24_009265 [Panaeolus cyanescens]|uniref:Uncharacterized protein n=1 Tax=Panaeolus cyanescens TaxID=181874 RepID=A0A409Y8A4_9AGAR|nr:hypothetical protein CVT24_009265 [Panaeolus cyanescens]
MGSVDISRILLVYVMLPNNPSQPTFVSRVHSMPETLKDSTARVVIIGAGAGGLACSIYLKEKLGFTNFTVYEKASGVGGTWRDNTYPGCASDVAVPFYSLSTDLRDWISSHGSNYELNEYWEDLAKKYQLYSHISFNTKVISATWDGQSQQYDILLVNVATGERSSTKAEVLISAIGILENPRYADIPGVGDFQGELFHSARWDHTVELRGKRVGVIGNGASATQFVPIITRDEAVNVVHFCRTPNFFFPDVRIKYSETRRWLRQNIPLVMRIERLSHFFRAATKYILSKAPPKYHDKLVPDFGLGCKRVIIDTDYLDALHRPNLEMNWDGIDRIVQDGILTKKGETIPVDVLIFATGYSADKYQLPVVGRKGNSIQEYYDSQQGAKAYLGTTVPGFPNFFTIFGPNTATGHTSVIYTNEVQINYILQLIKPILERKISSIEVEEKATDEYDAKIQKRLSKSVFTQCLSWYRVGQTGKITNAFPGSGTTFWLWLRKPDWSHYRSASTTAQAQNWLKKAQQKQKVISALVKIAIFFRIIFLLAWWRNPGLPGMIKSWTTARANVLSTMASDDIKTLPEKRYSLPNPTDFFFVPFQPLQSGFMPNVSPETLKNSTAKVAIIGAGAGGIACSIFLKEKYGFTNFTVYEKAAEVGGTWRDNTYPVGKHLPSIVAFLMNEIIRDALRTHAPQKDVKEYWEKLTRKYHIYPHISFNTKVRSATWDPDAQCYNIQLQNVVTGEETTSTAEVVISAIGVLADPRYPDIPGIKDFQRDLFHSARWEKSVELSGKRVGVVGNGASATQFVPLITKDKSVNVLQFCRTPNWFFPYLVHSYSSPRRWIRRNVPLVMKLERLGHFIRHEFLYWAVFSNSISRSILQKAASKYILYMAPKEYINKLLPNFGLGCKRIIFDSNYLNSLHRPNLDINWDGIDRIVKDGVLTKTGQHIPLDVLIFSTGYSADKYHLPIIGSKGKSIQEYHDSQAGAKAYLGTATPGFPNFFTILGPNTATGHTSVIFTNEIQINYTLQLIKPILERRIPSIEVKEKATDEYNETIQKRLSKSVFTQCLSWYRVGQKGKITNIFPGSGVGFWLLLRKPDWTHYHVATGDTQAHRWLKKVQRKQKIVSALIKAAVAFRILFLLAWWRNPALLSTLKTAIVQKATFIAGSVALANWRKLKVIIPLILRRMNVM